LRRRTERKKMKWSIGSRSSKDTWYCRVFLKKEGYSYKGAESQVAYVALYAGPSSKDNATDKTHLRVAQR
jgi:hypothetical protein